MQKNLASFDALNAAILAINVDKPATSLTMTNALKLTIPVLSDTKTEAIRAYDVLDPILGISKHALFVLDGTGVIRWKRISASATPTTLLTEIKKIAAPTFPTWDVDKSGNVDIRDLVGVSRLFGVVGFGLAEDVDKNGVVDIADLVMVARHFGE